jgi:hypothetical protein
MPNKSCLLFPEKPTGICSAEIHCYEQTGKAKEKSVKKTAANKHSSE